MYICLQLLIIRSEDLNSIFSQILREDFIICIFSEIVIVMQREDFVIYILIHIVS
jgi:hypothetical protein